MTRHIIFLLLALLFHPRRTRRSAHMSLCHQEQILLLQVWDKVMYYFEIIVPGSYIMSFSSAFQVLFSLQLPWLSASVSLLVRGNLALETLNAPPNLLEHLDRKKQEKNLKICHSIKIQWNQIKKQPFLTTHCMEGPVWGTTDDTEISNYSWH